MSRLQYGVGISRDNVALFVCLQAHTGEKICVGTVHLYWGNSSHSQRHTHTTHHTQHSQHTQRSTQHTHTYPELTTADPQFEWIKVLQARHYFTQLHRFAEGLPIIGAT